MPLKDHGVFDLFNFEYLDMKKCTPHIISAMFYNHPHPPTPKKLDANNQNV